MTTVVHRRRPRDLTPKQAYIYLLIEKSGTKGITNKELVLDLASTDYHGPVSGATSTMHKKGYITALKKLQNRKYVYLLPRFVQGRETRKPRKNRNLADAWDAGAEAGFDAKAPMDLEDVFALNPYR